MLLATGRESVEYMSHLFECRKLAHLSKTVWSISEDWLVRTKNSYLKTTQKPNVQQRIFNIDRGTYATNSTRFRTCSNYFKANESCFSRHKSKILLYFRLVSLFFAYICCYRIPFLYARFCPNSLKKSFANRYL